MKRLFLALSLLAIGSVSYAGQGQSNALKVSSGTYLNVQGFGNNSGNFVQGIAVADSSFTVSAPVDGLNGMAVYLTTGTGIVIPTSSTVSGSVSITGTPAVTVTGPVSQSGVFQVEPGSNTFRAAIENTVPVTGTFFQATQPIVVVGTPTITFNGAQAVTQSGNWQVEPGTNTFKAAIQNTVTINSPAVTQSGVWQVEPGSNTFRTAIENTPAVSESGTWTVQPGNTANTIPWLVTMTTNAVNVTQFGGSNVVQSGTAGEPRISCDINGSSNTVSASVTASVTNITTGTIGGSLPIAAQFIAGIGPSGTLQSFAVDASSQMKVTGSFSATSVNITTATYGQAFPAVGSAIGGVNSNGAIQTFRVDATSDVYVTIAGTPPVSGTVTSNQGTANIIPWLVTMTTNAVTGTLGDNGSAATTNRAGVLPGIYQTNLLNGTAATQGRDAAMSVGTDGLLWTAQLPSLRPAGFMASTGTISSAASATDIACLQGNASNTVLVTGLRVSGTQTTAGNVHMSVIKRSTAYTGAWSTMTIVADDSSMNVGVSSVAWFQANPTVGTAVGVVDDYDLGVMAPATATPNDIYISPSIWRTRPIVLRGATQGLCVNLNATTVTGGSFTVGYTWYEVSTITP